MLPVALVLAAAGIIVAVKLSGCPNVQQIAAGLKMPVAYVQLACKASKRYHVPFEWVLATILVESSGNPMSTGDADGRSVGLMQVNVIAHEPEMRAAGLTRTQMFVPAINIDWGTKLLARFYRDVRTALGGRSPPAPLDEITRLAYKGPRTVEKALRKGDNPQDLSWAPEALRRWRNALMHIRTAAATPVTPRVT